MGNNISTYFSALLNSYARRFVLRTLENIRTGKVSVIVATDDDDGGGKEQSSYCFGGEDVEGELETTLVVMDERFWWRLCLNLDLGMAEGFMLGEVECSDIVKLFTIYIHNRKQVGVGSFLVQVMPRLRRLLFMRSNTVSNSLKNIVSHYDVSNDLFSGFMSGDMNYSCPIWSTTAGEEEEEALESAQLRKVHNIIRKARIKSTDHVLEIGCGWAHLAIEAVRLTGCRVTGTTLSVEQKRFAEEKIRQAGFADKITILLCDYRETPFPEGGYDKIVLVEMLEHVGRDLLPVLFGCISRMLKVEDGLVVIQGTTVINDRHDTKAELDTFIDRYVFPGGYIPSTYILLDSIHSGSRGELEVRDVQYIGPHYAKALRLWREKFLKNWEEGIKPLLRRDDQETRSADMEFLKRKWEYYFSYCEAGFRTGMLGNCVITASRQSNRDLFEGVPL